MATRPADGPWQLPVTVLYPIPTFCQAVAQALDSNRFVYQSVEKLGWRSWLNLAGRRAALVCVDSVSSWDRVAEAAHSDDVTTIAIVPQPDVRLLLRALRLGADGVSSLSDPPSRIVQALDAALTGDVLLACDDARRIARESRLDTELSEPEAVILQALVEGRRPGEIAAMSHLSPRTARRRIRRICEKLDASSVPAAILVAKRMGLV